MAEKIRFDIPINTALLDEVKGTSLESKYKPVGEFYNNDGQVGSTDYYASSMEVTEHREVKFKFNTYKGGRATLHLYPEKLFGPEGNGFNFQGFSYPFYYDVPYDPKEPIYKYSIPYSYRNWIEDRFIAKTYTLKSNWYNWGDKWGTSYLVLDQHAAKEGMGTSWNSFEMAMGGNPDYYDEVNDIPILYDPYFKELYINKNSSYNRYDYVIDGVPKERTLINYYYLNYNKTNIELVKDKLNFDTIYYPSSSLDLINNKSNFTLKCNSSDNGKDTYEIGYAPQVTTSFIIRKKKHATPQLSYDKVNNEIFIVSEDGSIFDEPEPSQYTIKFDGKDISEYPEVEYYHNSFMKHKQRIRHLPKSLILGKHTVTVIRNTDNYLTFNEDESILEVITTDNEKPKPGYSTLVQITNSYTKWDVYEESDVASLTYENKPETPTDLKIEQLDVDKIKLSWKYSDTSAIFAVKQELNYDHIVHPVQTSTQETSMIIDNLPVGNHRFSVAASYPDIAGGLSNFAVITYASNKLLAPISISFTRKTANSGSITWKTQSSQDKFTSIDYGIKVNGTLYGDYVKDKTQTITKLSQGKNKISVFTHYAKNEDYNSIEYDIYPELSKISTPTIKLTENYSDVTYTDPDTGETVTVIGEDGKPKQGVSSVSVSWATDDASKYKGIEYILYDRFKEEVIAQPRTSDTKIELTTQATFKGVGKHNLYVKAIFVDDEGYNSDNSSEVSYEINTLAKPKLVWSNDLPDWNGKKIEESRLTWMPVTTGSTNNNHADYYLVKAIADNQQRGNSITLLQPADLNKRVSTFIPDPDPYTGAIKGLIAEDPAITTEYKINVYAMSFNEFYVGGSEPATADYKIIRLSAPQNVIWTPDNLTLSWEAVAEANTYYLYDDNIKIDETNSTSYKFAHIEDKLHVFNITANKITTEEA